MPKEYEGEYSHRLEEELRQRMYREIERLAGCVDQLEGKIQELRKKISAIEKCAAEIKPTLGFKARAWQALITFLTSAGIAGAALIYWYIKINHD